MAFIKIKNCLACGSKKLRKILDLNKQPLANSYLTKPNLKEKKYELKVNTCLDCTHLQLSIAVDPKIIYQNYDYVSGTTKTYLNYMREFYRFCIKNSSKFVNKNILDVGCNDGSQLNVFKKKILKPLVLIQLKIFTKYHQKIIKYIVIFLIKK